ncbi:peptidase S8/S53 domain-containing protein [Leptodontidium sp. 2 PMI_412]|nr:peptidase S8/S53 domain-containing protein [Leptodontidium sp. 2 PMI_412]
MLASTLLLGLSCSRAFGLPVSEDNYVVHEQLGALHPRWEVKGILPGGIDPKVQMRIAITQQNLHRGEEFLMEVSDPTSPLFGQHWSKDRIAEVFSPSEESTEAVKSWLVASGIDADQITPSRDGGWLTFHIGLSDAEVLLQAKYHVYTDSETGDSQLACDSYGVPQSVRSHIDFITPTVHLTTRKSKKARDLTKSHDLSLHPVKTSSLATSDLRIKDKDLTVCDKLTTPDCLRALYNMPEGKTANPKNTYGILELSPETYSQNGLDVFFKNFTKGLVGRPPKLESIDGGSRPPRGPPSISSSWVEGNLDLSYSMSLVYPQNVTLYQIGDNYLGGTFELFLDAVDGSYCTYLGGDDPAHNPQYPDPTPGGYNETKMCGGAKPPTVISISYGGDEATFTPFYTNRMCNEYMKLGLQGMSILFASADYGVAGWLGCLDPATTGTLFSPAFPASCPYVTSVGATQIPVNASVLDRNVEVAIDFPIVSSGGFSNHFAMPKYQEKAVLNWFKNNPTGYGKGIFNDSMKARGGPDVAALGRNFIVGVGKNLPYVPEDTYQLVGGTSASAPVFGAVLTLINEARLNAGKKPVGFVNPVVYAHPEVMNDITQGSNPGCGTNGFNATLGWDPVTGLGSPNFEKMLKLYMSLP